MPTKLSDFAADATASGAPLRVPSKGLRLPKSNFIGVVFTPKNLLPAIGSVATVTLPGGGGPVAITSLNLLSAIQAFAYAGQAWVFGNGAITGKRGKFKSDEEDMVFGSQRTKRDTGEGELTYSFTFKYGYHNTTFLNQLRLMFTEYDIYAFTDRSVEPILFDLNEPVFKNVSNGEIAGDNSKSINTGGFDIVVGSDGDIEPTFGLFESLLQLSNFKYTFGPPVVTGTGLVSTLGGTVITKTSSGSGTIAAAVTQTVSAGVVTYSLVMANSSALPTGLTIDSTTGTVSVAAGLVAGAYDVRVLVENKTGIMGQLDYKIVAS